MRFSLDTPTDDCERADKPKHWKEPPPSPGHSRLGLLVSDLRDKQLFEGGIITSLHKVRAMESSDASQRAIIETPAMRPAAFTSLVPWVSAEHEGEDGEIQPNGASLLRVDTRSRLRDGREGGDGELSIPPFGQGEHEGGAADFGGSGEVGTHRSDGQRIRCKEIKEEELEEFLDGICIVGGPRSRSEFWTMHASAPQMGSCRMGASEEAGGVVELGARGAVCVCDGSVVLPSAVGINPMITIQSVAYCLSKRIAESLKKS